MNQTPITLIEPSAHNYEVDEFVRYAADYPYVDDSLKHVLTRFKQLVYDQDDDCVILVAGQVDSGKSTLSHHIHTLWTMGAPDIENVALDKQSFAKSIHTSMTKDALSDRVCHYDEADVSKRDALTKFNKRVIHMYDAIRGKNGLHLWCNPSVEWIDKKFVQERVKCLIYTFRKPRGKYLLILRKKLYLMVQEYKSVNQHVIERYGKNCAAIHNNSFFKQYPNNAFLKSYKELKESRQDHILSLFRKDFFEGVDEPQTLSSVARMFKMSWPTLQKYADMSLREGVFTEDELKSPTGRWRIEGDNVALLHKFIKEKRGND
jgi:hypothetical protein